MNSFRALIKSAVIILFLMLVFLYLVDHDFDFLRENLSGNIHDTHHMASLNDASIIILTVIIACIAWVQLSGLIKTGQADFLMRIDERLGDKYIIEARKIIHEIYCESKKTNKNYSEEQHCEFMAQKINEIGEGTDEKSIKNYVLMLNFMDFLETVSLFTLKGYISKKEINDLMNQSLVFFFSIFKVRINERRRKYSDPSFYTNFETLVNKIQCHKSHCCNCCICIKCFLEL